MQEVPSPSVPLTLILLHLLPNLLKEHLFPDPVLNPFDESLSCEHRQWLGELSEARGAFARLENTLKEISSGNSKNPETDRQEK